MMALQACAVGPPAAPDTPQEEEDVASSECALGLENPPPGPDPGDSSGYPGGDHTGGPGDGYHHSLCDDPQYAGLCDPRKPSGAPPPGAPHSPPPSGSHPGHGGAFDLHGPSDTDIAVSKLAWSSIERRGERLLATYEEMYADEAEATTRACIASCTTSFSALCGYVDCVCSTGNSRVPFSPNVNTPCGAAKSASCEGDPNACIASCFGAGIPASAMGSPAGDGPGSPIRVSPAWRKSCHFACKVAEGSSCLAVSLSCAPGAVWTFGAAAIPCVYAVGAACLGSWTAGEACNQWCDQQ